jgi:hypothetical protein
LFGLMFFAKMWAWVRSKGGADREMGASMMLTGAIVGWTLATVGTGGFLAAGWMMDDGKLNADLAQLMYLMAYGALAMTAAGVTLGTFGFWVGTRGSAMVPGWLGWMAMLIGIFGIVSLVMIKSPLAIWAYVALLVWGAITTAYVWMGKDDSMMMPGSDLSTREKEVAMS